MDAVIDSQYIISLIDFPDLPLKERMVAEMRYGTALEKALGGPEQVATAYSAWCSVSDGSEAEITADKGNQVRTWLRAVDRARVAGFQGLSEAEGAYFEVKLV